MSEEEETVRMFVALVGAALVVAGLVIWWL
jgi:hypothetical protein